MKEVIVYTDGACSGNPGPGGWAALLRYKDAEREIFGAERETTNQRMEMQAAVEALKRLKEPCLVRLHSDSAYLINAFQQGWLDRWQKNGWQTAKKTPVENQDLWQELLKLSQRHRVTWVKVRGHSDNEGNNRCDYLAKQALTSL
ncbi:MAG: ribonuclease HI [Dethiobacteria bacterium]|jgi:ribonuclease HI